MRRRLAVALVGGILMVGCSVGGSPGAPSGGDPSSGATGAVASSGATGGTAGPGEFLNPVIAQDMPDPFVYKAGGTYYLYSTTDGLRNVPYATSPDLVSWTRGGDAMPGPPRWSDGDYWAPEIARVDDREYLMYFTARTPGIKRNDGQPAQCVGVAVSDLPAGPFVDAGDEPLLCQAELGGTIDASPFLDVDGRRWLIYKNDGNCCGIATRFYLRQLSQDGLSFVGEEIELEGSGAQADASWEGSVVEAPNIHLEHGTYYLFFSGNDYRGREYAVGYATSKSITGPYMDAEENPILETPDGGEPFGPGHQTLVADDDGDLWIVYHAWDREMQGRQIWMDELILDAGRAVVAGPDAGPQPIP